MQLAKKASEASNQPKKKYSLLSDIYIYYAIFSPHGIGCPVTLRKKEKALVLYKYNL